MIYNTKELRSEGQYGSPASVVGLWKLREEGVIEATRMRSEYGVFPDRYAIQRKADDGWFTIVGVPPDVEWDDSETVLDPGEGLSWQLTATREGMVEEPYVMCTLPSPETYRFVYWGLPDAEILPAVEFRIEENE